MESQNSESVESQETLETEPSETKTPSYKGFSERFESLLPQIQERWPEVAKQTLEATKGSLDDVVQVIADHSGTSPLRIKTQLEALVESASDRTRDFAESLEPLEKQLEELLDELNSSIRPKLEKPIRKRPLLSLGMATGIGIILGLLIAGGKRN